MQGVIDMQKAAEKAHSRSATVIDEANRGEMTNEKLQSKKDEIERLKSARTSNTVQPRKHITRPPALMRSAACLSGTMRTRPPRSPS